MRPQGFGQGGAALEDLGWNDMGFEPPKPAAIPAPDAEHDAFGEDLPEHPRAHPSGLTPVHSPVHSQQAQIADRLGGEEAGEGELDEEELDETAELYDPNALDETDVEDEEEDVESEEDFEPEAPLEPQPVFEPEAAFEPEDALELSQAFEPEPVFEPQPAFEPEPAFEPAPPVLAVRTLRAATTPRSAPGSKPKAAFTLRLEQERHLKLRLACAVDGRSAQQLVTDALDRLLAGMPELDAMAQSAKRKG
jgi:hypothetical protein